MEMIGVLIGDPSPWCVGGLTLSRRLERQLRAADAMQVLRAVDMLAVLMGVDPECPCLVLSANALVDDRIIAAVRDAPGAFAAISMTGGPDAPMIAAKVPAGWLTTHRRIGAPSLAELCRDAPVQWLDPALLPTYRASHRRHMPMIYLPVRTAREAAEATAVLLDDAQKGVQDWPAWYIHRPLERRLTDLLSRTFVTPNQITVLGGLLGLAAAGLFSVGRFAAGLALILIVGILDGVDGKLARVKMMAGTWGELEHVVDKVVEYLCYFGMARYFVQTGHGAFPYAMAGALVLFHVADEVQLEFFRRMSGRFMCDASAFDRFFRMIDGRRNTQFWTFIPFLLANARFAGFWMICIYGIVTFFVHQWRFVVNARRVLETTSAAFGESFRRTAVF